MTDRERSTVLLGAGASMDADLPSSVGLTNAIAAAISKQYGNYDKTARALHAAIGALVAHDTARGGDAYAGVDAERLFSAIQMLGALDDLEVTPFVASWNQAVRDAGSSKDLPTGFGSRLAISLLDSSPSNLETVFREGVQALVRRDSQAVFRRLQSQMVAALQGVLAVRRDAVDYLAPLLAERSRRPLQVATLNYDRSIEILAHRAGVTCDTGIANWVEGSEWRWSSRNGIRLLKLHGSVDWWHQRDHSHRMVQETIVVDAYQSAPDPARRLAVVFGQRGKLTSDGPFLAMLRGFDEFLDRSTRLLVVGYSFRDDHINSAIRRWLNKEPQARLTIIDPALHSLQQSLRSGPPFLQELLDIMTEMRTVDGLLGRYLKSGHHVIAKKARAGLSCYLGPGPALRSIDN